MSSDGMMMAVPLADGAARNAGRPARLFEARVPLTGNPYRTNYAVTANGQRFLVNDRVEPDPTAAAVTVVLNWTAALTP